METDAKLAAQINEKEYEESNMMMECMCCFGEYAFDNMTHCNELHFFCLDCARRNAETEVGNGRHVLACMDGSGCKAEFSRREVLRFLDERTLSALAKIEQEDALRIAEIEGLEKCPFCDFGAICAPVEVDKEFKCQNPECEDVLGGVFLLLHILTHK
jgi:TRIAD3 protein (E3 ubiquitin-protein ligase RNF216)